MPKAQDALDTVRRYLDKKGPGPRQDSTEDQINDLLTLGNALGLYDAVDSIRTILEKTSRSPV
jgi:hypothetical protein